jgi:hypothetical protein
MSAAALLDIRERIRNDEALGEWFGANYPGLPVNTFIGLQPDMERGTGVSTDFFPYISVSPLTQARPAAPSRDRAWRLSIMCGLYDEREHDGAALGMVGIIGLTERILAALAEQPVAPGSVWSGEAELRFDAGVATPYYEAEIILPIQVRQ